LKTFPAGDGDKDCTFCLGRGVVSDDEKPIFGSEITRPCVCTLKRDVLVNVERGWVGLAKAKPIEKSPLYGLHKENLWITASGKDLREHLRHIAVRMGPSWYFRVVTDIDLMNSWLAKDLPVIYDVEVEQARQEYAVSNQATNLTELIEAPELLIVRLGVKAARNSATPEVLLETLQHRDHLGKTTWVIDQKIYPLQAGHIAYSDGVCAFISDWKHIKLGVDDSVPNTGGIYQIGIGQAPVAIVPNRVVATDTPEDFKTGEEKRKGNKYGRNKR
jgi:hypothetical protein